MKNEETGKRRGTLTSKLGERKKDGGQRSRF
jgi:hypothetical protein